MDVQLYVEALLIDPNLADQIWESWNFGVISDDTATWAWWLCIVGSILPDDRRGNNIDYPSPDLGKGWMR